MPPVPPDAVRVRDVVVRGVRFTSEQARQPTPFEGSLVELVGGRHLRRAEKRGTPGFSPVVYAEGASRGKRGVIHATALALDFDHLTSNAAEEVAAALVRREWAHVAYSSWSHRADGDDDCCFRVVIAVSRPIRAEEYEPVWVAANTALGRLADANARDVTRLWFVAACPPERESFAWFRVVDGRPLDVDRALKASALKPEPRRKERKPRADSAPFPEGARNAGLTSLGGSLRRRGAGREELLGALSAANAARCRPPLEASEVEAIVDSLLRYDPASALLTLNLTDAGNAERLRAAVGEDFAYVHAWGSWMHFDGRRWVRDDTDEAVRAALRTLRRTAAEAAKVPDEDLRAELLKHALDSESSARISAMVSLGQAMLPVPTEAWDTDLDLLCVANGTLDLRTGALGPHRRGDRITRMVNVAWDPAATCPQWERFLLRVLGGSERLAAFVQRAVGYSLTGHTSEQVLFLLYGTGANGKSTFLETLRALLSDYAGTADFTTFLKKDGDGARNDLARLVGTRFVSAVEAEAGRALAESLVKQLTGGDMVTVRFLFKEFFEYRPLYKIWLAANHRPHVSGADHGIWRRIRLVPFTVTIPEAERDPRLTEKLTAELPGILAWAVRGCLAWRSEGLGAPEEVRSATEAYRDEMDVFGGFLGDRCVASAGAHIAASELYDAYTEWCASNGEKPRSQKSLANGLKERGLEAGKATKGVRVWKGIRLRRDSDPAGGGWRMGGAFSHYVEDRPTFAQSGAEAPSLAKDGALIHYGELPPPSAIRHPEVDDPPSEDGAV